jgi:hypothetical protein
MMTIKEAKKIDLVDYLSKLGHEPAEPPKGNTYWYYSMLPGRSENTPSFKVNRKMNAWYDFGEGIGGSLIDFGIRYHNCTVSEFLQLLSSSSLSPSQHQQPAPKERTLQKEEEPEIKIFSARTITAYPSSVIFKQEGFLSRSHPSI